MEWGVYIVNMYNLNLFHGRYGVRTLRTPGDTVDITHFSVFGGWVLHQSQAAFFFDRALNTLVINVATEGEYSVAPYMVQNSYLMTVLLGEAWQDTIAVVSNDSHAITFESPGPLDAKRFVVDETSDVSYRSGSGARYYPSLGDPTYSVAIEANYRYTKPFALKVRGGSAEREMIAYSEPDGLELDLYYQSLKLHNSATAASLPSITSGIPMPGHVEKLLRVQVNGQNYLLPLLKAE
jgi:hypothetical protein